MADTSNSRTTLSATRKPPVSRAAFQVRPKSARLMVVSPSKPMRLVQYRILKEVLEPLFEVPEYVHAFEKERSIPVMARIHVGKRVVVSLDLKD